VYTCNRSTVVALATSINPSDMRKFGSMMDYVSSVIVLLRGAKTHSAKTIYLYRRSVPTQSMSFEDSEITQLVSDLTNNKKIFINYNRILKDRLNQTVVRKVDMIYNEQQDVTEIAEIDFKIMKESEYSLYLKETATAFMKFFRERNKKRNDIMFSYMSIILSHMLSKDFINLKDEKKFENLLKKHYTCYNEINNFITSNVLGEIDNISERCFAIKLQMENKKKKSDEIKELLNNIDFETINIFSFLDKKKTEWTNEETVLFNNHNKIYYKVKQKLSTYQKSWHTFSNDLYKKGVKYLFGSFILPSVESSTCSDKDLMIYDYLFPTERNKAVTKSINTELQKLPDYTRLSVLFQSSNYQKVVLKEKEEQEKKNNQKKRKLCEMNTSHNVVTLLSKKVDFNINPDVIEIGVSPKKVEINNFDINHDVIEIGVSPKKVEINTSHNVATLLSKKVEIGDCPKKVEINNTIINPDLIADFTNDNMTIDEEYREDIYYQQILNYLTDKEFVENYLTLNFAQFTEGNYVTIDEFIKSMYGFWLDPKISEKDLYSIIFIKLRINVNYHELSGLHPNAWLSDTIINLMAEIVNFIFFMLHTDENPTSTYCWSTFFFTKLLENNVFDYNFVKDWATRMKIFDYKKMFFPINVRNTHWTLIFCHINSEDRIIEISYYDSIGPNKKISEKFCSATKLWFQAELSRRNILDSYSFVMKDKSIRQQYDSNNCGVIVIQNIIRLALNQPILVYKDQQHLIGLRSLIAYLCLDSKMLALPFVEDIEIVKLEAEFFKPRPCIVQKLRNDTVTPIQSNCLRIVDNLESKESKLSRFSNNKISVKQYKEFLQKLNKLRREAYIYID